MKKKVLFALGGKVYPHITGGMEIFNYNLIRELKDYFDIYYTSSEPLDYPGVTHLRVSQARPQKFLSPLQVLYYLLKNRDVMSLVLSYSEASWILWYMYYLVLRVSRVKCTLVIHYGNPSVGVHKNAVGKLFKASENIVAVSPDIKANYDKAFGIDCKLIYPAIRFNSNCVCRDELLKRWSIPEKSFVISMVGSLKTMKNPDTLIECLNAFSPEELDKYNPAIIYAGDGHMRKELEEYSVLHGMTGRVRFLGTIPQENVCEVLAVSDCYVSASDFEGTSVSLMEAMHAKVPAIVADVPGLRDMIEDGVCGQLFTRKNPESLKRHIIRYIEDRIFAEQMATGAYDRYQERYATEKVIDNFLSIL